MKLLGHGYIAVNSVPRGNKQLLILGSIVPEIMYYTKDHSFTFEEIHEGGNLVYGYLKQRQPDLADFGLGMISHSVKYGADKFNLDENLALLGYEGEKSEELRNQISKVLGVSYETAKVRVHNILELAVEIGIIKDNPAFVSTFGAAITNTEFRKEASNILTCCFQKDRETVDRSVEELFTKAKPEYFTGAEGLARLWAELTREFDPPPDIDILSDYLDKLATSFDGRNKEFLAECVSWTKSNLERISRHPERL